jgi:ATP-dependent RNA helicase DDX27
MSIENQTIQLKSNPDVLIATPGRLIDMLYNYKSVNCLENINIVVLDEADKLLELGFKDGINELITMIKDNSNRQTLLFSATLNTKIVDLGKDTLKNPVKIKMVKSAILTNLKQSIVRMRFKTSTEENVFEQRMAYLINLLQTYCKSRSIIFFNTKKDCHKAYLVLKSHLINSTELHSDIPQHDRLKALNSFQSGDVQFLLCTDVASRGIDVEKVRFVINFQMPVMDERYIHRIGRTARKGYLGQAITICDDKDRQTLKKLLKKEKFVMSNIKIDNGGIKKIYLNLIAKKGDINQQLENYLIDKELMIAEKDVEKTINMKLHSNDIYNRPKKAWFMGKKEKAELQKKMKEELKK